EDFGFRPHTTWSRTTFANADAILHEIAFDGAIKRIGVLRTYCTRHGPGPMVSQDDSLRDVLPEPHNSNAGWQGRFRVGGFDLPAARYAIQTCGHVDALAITHLDRLPRLPRSICSEYQCDAKRIEINQIASNDRSRVLAKCKPVFIEASSDPAAFVNQIQ